MSSSNYYEELRGFLDEEKLKAYIEIISVDQPKRGNKLDEFTGLLQTDGENSEQLLPQMGGLIRDSMLSQGDGQMV